MPVDPRDITKGIWKGVDLLGQGYDAARLGTQKLFSNAAQEGAHAAGRTAGKVGAEITQAGAGAAALGGRAGGSFIKSYGENVIPGGMRQRAREIYDAAKPWAKGAGAIGAGVGAYKGLEHGLQDYLRMPEGIDMNQAPGVPPGGFSKVSPRIKTQTGTPKGEEGVGDHVAPTSLSEVTAPELGDTGSDVAKALSGIAKGRAERSGYSRHPGLKDLESDIVDRMNVQHDWANNPIESTLPERVLPERPEWGIKNNLIDILNRFGHMVGGMNSAEAGELSERSINRGYYDDLAEYQHGMQRDQQKMQAEAAQRQAFRQDTESLADTYKTLTGVDADYARLDNEDINALAGISDAGLRLGALENWKTIEDNKINIEQAELALQEKDVELSHIARMQEAMWEGVRAVADVYNASAQVSGSQTERNRSVVEFLHATDAFDNMTPQQVHKNIEDSTQFMVDNANRDIAQRTQLGTAGALEGWEVVRTPDGVLTVQPKGGAFTIALFGDMSQKEQALTNWFRSKAGLDPKLADAHKQELLEYFINLRDNIIDEEATITANAMTSTRLVRELATRRGEPATGVQPGGPGVNFEKIKHSVGSMMYGDLADSMYGIVPNMTNPLLKKAGVDTSAYEVE